MRTGTDMMHPHDSPWIDQDVAPQLPPVPPRFARQPATKYQDQVPDDGRQPVNAPPASARHSVGRVKLLVRVQQQRPWQLRFPEIRKGHEVCVERDDFDTHIQLVQPLFLLPQLRQVLTTRRSTEMAMKNQQQPVTRIFLETMDVSVGIFQLKINCGFSKFRIHVADAVAPRSNFHRVDFNSIGPCSTIRVSRSDLPGLIVRFNRISSSSLLSCLGSRAAAP
jgi:hypothetical protein